MTVIRMNGRDDGGGDGDRDILDIAEKEVRDLIRDLSDLKDDLQQAEASAPDAKVRKTLADVRTTLRSVLTEKDKLNDLRKREAGIAHDYAINLDAARDEIRRRLDRLRTARDTRIVPE